jgi:hypothetical protein
VLHTTCPGIGEQAAGLSAVLEDGGSPGGRGHESPPADRSADRYSSHAAGRPLHRDPAVTHDDDPRRRWVRRPEPVTLCSALVAMPVRHRAQLPFAVIV